MAEFLINGFLIFLLAIIAVVAIRSIKIFSTVMLAGAYSLICAIIFAAWLPPKTSMLNSLKPKFSEFF